MSASTAAQAARQAAAWTPEMIDRLKHLWTQEGYSHTQIAQAISTETGWQITKNSVAAKVGRLGLKGQGGNQPGGQSRDKSKRLPAATPGFDELPPTSVGTIRTPALEPDASQPQGYRLVDMKSSGQCKYAIGEHRGVTLFCGEPAPVGPGNPHGSWCEAHRALVFAESENLGRPAFLKRRAMVR